MSHTVATLTRHIARHARNHPASPVLPFVQSCLTAAVRAEQEGRAKDTARILRDGYLELVRIETAIDD